MAGAVILSATRMGFVGFETPHGGDAAFSLALPEAGGQIRAFRTD